MTALVLRDFYMEDMSDFKQADVSELGVLLYARERYKEKITSNMILINKEEVQKLVDELAKFGFVASK